MKIRNSWNENRYNNYDKTKEYRVGDYKDGDNPNVDTFKEFKLKQGAIIIKCRSFLCESRSYSRIIIFKLILFKGLWQ